MLDVSPLTTTTPPASLRYASYLLAAVLAVASIRIYLSAADPLALGSDRLHLAVWPALGLAIAAYVAWLIMRSVVHGSARARIGLTVFVVLAIPGRGLGTGYPTAEPLYQFSLIVTTLLCVAVLYFLWRPETSAHVRLRTVGHP